MTEALGTGAEVDLLGLEQGLRAHELQLVYRLI